MKNTLPIALRPQHPTRREFLCRSFAATAGLFVCPSIVRALPEESLPTLPKLDRRAQAPTATVSLRKSTSFEVKDQAALLSQMFDDVGGIKKLVGGKTVSVKLNTTGNGRQRMRGKPAERSYQVHPNQVEALVGLLSRAGAKRIYLIESFYETKKPEEILASQGWKIDRIKSAGDHKVFFEDTRNRGSFKDYAKIKVPWGGFTFPAYHLNRRYEETDVLVSIAKVKEHVTAGVTGAVKNLFGIAPTSLYGADGPNEETISNRAEVLHFGAKKVPSGVTDELDPKRERLERAVESYFRVPMVTADLFGVRPVDLSIVEGIETCRGGEGPWCPRTRPVKPGYVLVGKNAVTVDSVMTTVMGFDPLAGTRQKPWFGYNHLELLARAGVGTNDPGRIEVVGVPMKDAVFRYKKNVRGWLDKQG